MGIPRKRVFTRFWSFCFANCADKGLNNIVITAQPKRQVAGIPDFTVRKGKELIGYIEAKDIGFKLEDLEYSDQIEKYKQEFDNFIFTNYFDFAVAEKREEMVMKVSASVAPLLRCATANSRHPKRKRAFKSG